MSKLFKLTGLVGVIFLVPFLTQAKLIDKPISTSSPSASDCFNYYKFQSVVIDLQPAKKIYKAGEKAVFNGSVLNKNTYPVVDGTLVLRLSKINSEVSLGNDILEQWTAQKNINLNAAENKSLSAEYQLPSGLATGSYVLTSYFLEADKFNLAGLTFTDDIYGGITNFNIEGGGEKSVFLDRAGAKVNGQPFRLFGFFPKNFAADAKQISFSIPLKNELTDFLPTSVRYDLYGWDSVDPKNLLKSWNQSLILKPSSSQILSAVIDVTDRPVYLLKIQVRSGDRKSEVEVRLTKDGFRPRINFVGLTKFPLTPNAPAVLFACFHNTTNGEGAGRMEIKAEDEQGNVVANTAYSGLITGNISLLSKEFINKNNLDKLNLSAKLYDQKNNLVDEVELPYDCKNFDPSLCARKSLNIYILAAGVLLVIVSSLALYRHNKAGAAEDSKNHA